MNNLLFILLFVLSGSASLGQAPVADSVVPKSPTAISYTLSIQSDKNDGVAESYNGAIKTLFFSDKLVRNRMVSLMRVQSIFYNARGTEPSITIVKESGDKKYKRVLTQAAWNKMNSKYKDVHYEFLEDSTEILNYKCHKVIVHVEKNKTITAYYTNQLGHPLFAKIEPAFVGIPGVVLQYEYQNKQALFVYTATEVSFNTVPSDIYKIP